MMYINSHLPPIIKKNGMSINHRCDPKSIIIHYDMIHDNVDHIFLKLSEPYTNNFPNFSNRPYDLQEWVCKNKKPEIEKAYRLISLIFKGPSIIGELLGKKSWDSQLLL